MIRGKTIGLRAVEMADLDTLKYWRNRTDFRKNFREFRELNLEDQLSWFKSLQDSRNGNFMFVMEDLETGEAVGAAGLLYVNWQARFADVSFYIGKEGWYIDTQGLANEAARLLVEYGFKTLNLNKLWMELYEFDTRKLRFFMDDFGFKVDGILRENCFENGRFWDSKIISLLREDYLAMDSL